MSLAIYYLSQFLFQAALGGFVFFTVITLGILLGRLSWVVEA